MNKQNLFQQAVRNELVWMGTIIIAVIGFVYKVIIPLNTIQVEMFQVLTQYKNYDDRITQNSNDIIKLQDALNLKK